MTAYNSGKDAEGQGDLDPAGSTPQRASDEVTAFYKRYWRAPEAAIPEGSKLIQRRWKELNKFVAPGDRVLDFGCGGGIFAARLSEAGCHVVGVDICPEPLELARSRVPRAEFLQISPGQRIPVQDGELDAVWASEVLEHIYNTESLIREFARVLRPGGRLIVTVPYHGLIKNVLISLLMFDRYYNPTGPHVRFFTKKTLVDLCQGAGFALSYFQGLGRPIPHLWKSMFVVFELKD